MLIRIFWISQTCAQPGVGASWCHDRGRPARCFGSFRHHPRKWTLFFFFSQWNTRTAGRGEKIRETCCTRSHSGHKPGHAWQTATNAEKSDENLFSILIQVLTCRHAQRVLIRLLLPPDMTLLWCRWWQTAVYMAVCRLKYDLKRANIGILLCVSTCSPSDFYAGTKSPPVKPNAENKNSFIPAAGSEINKVSATHLWWAKFNIIYWRLIDLALLNYVSSFLLLFIDGTF